MSVTNDDTVSTYSAHVKEYLEDTIQEASNEVAAWLDSALSHVDTSAKILELGSGTGKDARYVESKGYAVERTDAAEGFVDYLQSQGYKARMLNALNDEYGTGYNLIFADAVMLHFNREQFLAVLHNVSNALAPNGYFAFSVKQGNGYEETTRKLNGPRFFSYWQAGDLEEMLKAARFKIVENVEGSDYRADKPAWFFIITQKVKA